MKQRFEIWSVLSTVIILLYGLFLVYPLFLILQNSFSDLDGSFSFVWFEKFFTERYYLQTLINSFSVTVWVTLVTMLLCYPLAYF